MSKNRIIPVDVKKGKGILTSLKHYKEHNACDVAIKISANNYGFDETQNLLTIPHYMVFLLCEDIKNNRI